MSANDASDASVDADAQLAAQSDVYIILGPCIIGWMIQLFMGGMATALAGSILLNRRTKAGRLSRPLLSAASLFNLAAIIVNAMETWEYTINQDRTLDKLNGYTNADAIVPLFQGLTAATCQTFMAIRCTKLTSRKHFVWPLLTAGIIVSLGGAVWLTVENFRYAFGFADTTSLLAPTELWLWAAVTTDVTLTVILSWSLRGMKRGFNRSTDRFISDLIKLSFGSCAVPLLFTTFTAISYAATYSTLTYWNMFNATAGAIPSLYLISFCYCLRQSAASHRKMTETGFTSDQSGRATGMLSAAGSPHSPRGDGHRKSRFGHQPTQTLQLNANGPVLSVRLPPAARTYTSQRSLDGTRSILGVLTDALTYEASSLEKPAEDEAVESSDDDVEAQLGGISAASVPGIRIQVETVSVSEK